MEANITVRSIYRNIGRSSRILATNGTYYSVLNTRMKDTACVDDFQEGGTYDITYTPREGTGQYAGKIFNNVNKIVGNPIGNAAQRVVNGSRPAAPGERMRTNEEDAKRMWVCALLGHCLQAGSVPVALTEIVEAGKIFLESHALIFDTKPAQPAPQPMQSHAGNAPPDPELNDSIPW